MELQSWSTVVTGQDIQKCNKTGNTGIGVAEAGIVTGQKIQKCNKTGNSRLGVTKAGVVDKIFRNATRQGIQGLELQSWGTVVTG